MADERCDCCDLLLPSCGKQVEQQQRREAAAARQRLLNAGWFLATWPGTCARCDEHFAALSLIAHNRGGGYIAECCS